LNITEIAGVDQKIISFGQFLSGQNLGNRLAVSNKTFNLQTFSLEIDGTTDTFPETAQELLAPFNQEDLPFQSTSNDFKLAKNS
jgi:hypothetical protein